MLPNFREENFSGIWSSLLHLGPKKRGEMLPIFLEDVFWGLWTMLCWCSPSKRGNAAIFLEKFDNCVYKWRGKCCPFSGRKFSGFWTMLLGCKIRGKAAHFAGKTIFRCLDNVTWVPETKGTCCPFFVQEYFQGCWRCSFWCEKQGERSCLFFEKSFQAFSTMFLCALPHKGGQCCPFSGRTFAGFFCHI